MGTHLFRFKEIFYLLFELQGKHSCPRLLDTNLEDAFIESYKLLCYNNSDVLDELVNRMENVLSDNNFQKRLIKIENEIQSIEQKRNRLIDMRLEEVIDKSTYEKKYGEIELVLEGLLGEKEQLEKSSNEDIDLEKRIEHFRKVLEKNEVLTEFDRYVFESIVEKVIIGEVDEDGNTNPYKLTFIYKTEYSNSIQSKMHKQINRKRTQNDVKDLPSHPSTDTC
jgi:site-specific DNA recombinase